MIYYSCVSKEIEERKHDPDGDLSSGIVDVVVNLVHQCMEDERDSKALRPRMRHFLREELGHVLTRYLRKHYSSLQDVLPNASDVTLLHDNMDRTSARRENPEGFPPSPS